MKKNVGIYLCLGGALALGLLLYFMYFRTYTVTFTAYIGAGVAPVSVKSGDTIKEVVLEDTSEFEFKGWYLNGEKFDFNTPIKGDITLEAKWEKIENN